MIRFLDLKKGQEQGSTGGGRRTVRIRLGTPPSSLRKPHDCDTTQNRAFLRGSPATYFSDFGLCGRSPALAAVFGALSPHPKIPFPAAGFGTKSVRTCSRNSAFCAAVIQGSLVRRGNYSELSPSASNCRLHSVGGSRSRSMPMPRGRRPSTAALTRLGARKASEMAIFTCRTLDFSRTQSPATVVTRLETTSSSHRRPRAIALTRRARRSNCSGRTLLRDALCGSRIWRGLLDGGFCQGIVSD